LASCHRKAGRLDEAIALIHQCIEIQKQNLPSGRSDLCTLLNNLGSYYFAKGMLDEAMKSIQECLTAKRAFLPPNHPDIGRALWNLGNVYDGAQDFGKAAKCFRECLSVFDNSLPWTHPDLINVLWDLGEISFDQGGYGESLQMRRRLHDIYLEISPNSKEMAAVCHNMGVCYGKLSLLDAAEESFTKALNIKRSLFPPGHDRIRSTERELHRTWQWKYGQ
jgi:serine/threonine-protein kinase